MPRDWHRWHEEYDDPASSLSRRAEVVRGALHRALAEHPRARLLSLCSGEGRDTLPVLAAFPEVHATLVEIDPQLAATARTAAAEAGLERVQVRTADAGTLASYDDVTPVDVLMLCGVLGNIADADAVRTIGALPHLLTQNGVVIWTRGMHVPDDPTELDSDPSSWIRDLARDHGLEEVSFVRPDDARFRVGVARWPAPRRAEAPREQRLFSFV